MYIISIYYSHIYIIWLIKIVEILVYFLVFTTNMTNAIFIDRSYPEFWNDVCLDSLDGLRSVSIFVNKYNAVLQIVLFLRNEKCLVN